MEELDPSIGITSIQDFRASITSGNLNVALSIASRLADSYGAAFPKTLATYITETLVTSGCDRNGDKIKEINSRFARRDSLDATGHEQEDKVQIIKDSGLFDSSWYSRKLHVINSDIGELIIHFLAEGSTHKLDPHPLFSTEYYNRQRQATPPSNFNALLHFINIGWKLGLSPYPLFDHDWYLDQNPDVKKADINAFLHFLLTGAFEMRDPHQLFSVSSVFDKCPWLMNKRVNPLLYWAVSLAGSNQDPLPKATFFRNQKLGLYKDSIPSFPSGHLVNDNSDNTQIKAIALYLPQFHEIPENNQWWGKGFTEWTNVKRGTGFFKNHYQPHIPHSDISYYDLANPVVMEKQAKMAKDAGIYGFCFYYYWFNGRRLLHKPIDSFLNSGIPDFPFCFCWANENWTRTWDGLDREILISQEHTLETDIDFIWDLIPALKDKRYIRVEGKPLIIIYRPGLFKKPKETFEAWRQICRDEEIGEIFLARMEMFVNEADGIDACLDAQIQFPPVGKGQPPINGWIRRTSVIRKFEGSIFDYNLTAVNYAFDNFSERLWPGVCPSWDNTARRLERASAWINASPQDYYIWLCKSIERASRDIPVEKRFLFINAWNEWGEGCHLEPDSRYGYQWLNATKLALANPLLVDPNDYRLNILVIGHDAARAGAQIVLLTLLQEWASLESCDFKLVLLRDGVLRKEYEEICETVVLSDFQSQASAEELLVSIGRTKFNVVIANTVVVGPFLGALKRFNIPIVTYVHELQKSIERWAPGEIMATTITGSDHFIAVSQPVAENLVRNHGIAPEDISCSHPYIKTSYTVGPERLSGIYSELAVRPGEKIVFGCGTIDWRKGPDLFAEVAKLVLRNVPDACFLWIGADTHDEAAVRAHAVAADEPRIRFLGEREAPRDYLAIGAAFLLSSREDPFPLVALEAADAGLPVVCFAGAGGIPGFVGNDCGRTVPFEDVGAAAEALAEILSNVPLRESLGRTAQASVRSKHGSEQGSAAVLAILERLSRDTASPGTCEEPLPALPMVSVILPSYNHARFLPERLCSIALQTLTDIEIILLDDCSTDKSMDLLRAFAAGDSRARLLPNTENSGSTFKQWRKGLAEARGKYIWIAESDDSAEPELLAILVGKLEVNPAAVLAACCPCSIDIDGLSHGPPRQWYNELLGTKWESDYTANGLQEIRDVLSRKNAILNASGVVFRNFSGLPDLVEDGMSLCADWLFWVRLLSRGDFVYSHRMLNKWRMNSSNARTKPPGDLEWREGSRVLGEIAGILGLNALERANLIHTFSKKCQSWLATHLRGAAPTPLLNAHPPKLSVIIPNFNYAAFLPERIDSILGQTIRDFEILILDDASTDSSLEVIEAYRSRFPDLIRVITNSANSGSPYPQWLRGIREANGDLVWIAEADDSCEPDFLESLLPFFDDSSIGIAYSQSLGIDDTGLVTRTDFLEHTEHLHPERWKADYTELGMREALDWMACRNTIPNASAALIRREALLGLGEELLAYRSCGDWFLYLSILRSWNIAYCARSLNKFRRHDNAVTCTTNQSEDYLHELAQIRLFVSQAFPLHRSQIPRLDDFLDRDYVFANIPRPSKHPAVRPILDNAERNTDGRLRLAFISTTISNHSGGSEILWQKAALEARRRGHDVVVLTKAWNPPPPFSAEFANIGIKHLETENFGHDSVIGFRPDLTIISTANQDEGWLEFQKFPPASIPYIVVNQLTKEEQYSPLPDYTSLLRHGIAQAKRVFFTSKNNHQLMERRLGCSIPHWEQFFNPLDIPHDRAIPMPDFTNGVQIAVPANILFIHKGHDILLEVMSMEKWRSSHVTINLYGKGDDIDKVRKIIDKEEIQNVHLRGHIPPEEIWKQNHAILLASRMEGQSMAMIGAMMAGRVPIVTAVGGSAEVIRDNETGFLAATPSVDDLDDAMERAYLRRNEWLKIGQAARKSVLDLIPDNPIKSFVDRMVQLSNLQ